MRVGALRNIGGPIVLRFFVAIHDEHLRIRRCRDRMHTSCPHERDRRDPQRGVNRPEMLCHMRPPAGYSAVRMLSTMFISEIRRIGTTAESSAIPTTITALIATLPHGGCQAIA